MKCGTAELIERGFLREALIHSLAELWEGKELLPSFEIVQKNEALLASDNEPTWNIDRLSFLNHIYLQKLSPSEVASLAFSFCAEYQSLINDQGETFWVEVIGSVQKELQGFWQIEQLCEILFCYEIPFDQSAQEFLAVEENFVVSHAVAQLWLEFISNIELEDGSDTISPAIYKRFLSFLKKQIPYDQKTIEKVMKICLFGAVLSFKVQNLIGFIQRERLISRAELALKSLS